MIEKDIRSIPVPIEPAFAELPLDDFLAVLWPDRSKEGIRELFARGAVRSKGLPVSPLLRAGALTDLSLHADPAGLPAIHLAPDELQSGVRIIHQDLRLTVLEKPSGVPVIPDRDRRSPSCLGFLITRELAARAGTPPAGWSRPRVVHRIDRQTSGVVIMARSLAAEVLLAEMFQAGELRKEYLALLTGEVEPARITVNIPIAPGRKGKMRAAPGGKASLTVFDVLERFPGFTLVRASPRTGHTHQIRVHAWAIGHPLAVDPLYRVGAAAALPAPPAIARLTLHAERIVLPERWGGEREFVAEMPADFREAIAALRARLATCDLRLADDGRTNG